MWSGGRTTNEHGESVLLLQPVSNNHHYDTTTTNSKSNNSNSNKRRNNTETSKKSTNPSSSHVGGFPSYHPNDIVLLSNHSDTLQNNNGDDDNARSKKNVKCTKCDGTMHLILQLHAPLDAVDRTLYVFGCNNAPCHSSGSGTGTGSTANSGERTMMEGVDATTNNVINRFHASFGNGELRCFRSQQPWKSISSVVTASTSSPAVSKTEAPCNDNNSSKNILEDNDWGIDNDDDDGSDWGLDDGGDDDWGVDGGGGGDTTTTKKNNDVSMDDLETMLTQCEMQHSASKAPQSVEPSKKTKSTLTTTTTTPSSSTTIKQTNLNENISGGPLINTHASQQQISPSFDHHDLEMMDEPSSTTRGNNNNSNDDNDDDDDDDDVGYSNIDASKVNQMLSRYLDMEDDDEILSALKGGGGGGGGGNGGSGGGGERYERLPPEERAFLAFSKRLKRAPRQVARYAYGGTPLWSVPLPPPVVDTTNGSNKQQQQQQRSQKSKNKKGQKKKVQKKEQRVYSPLPTVPNCVCGAKRVFEFQILPSILHALDVDAHAAEAEKGGDDDVMDLITTGGMNWGSVAVYSCSDSCDASREEYMIVQEAGADCDGAPVVRKVMTAGGNGDDDDDDDDGMDDN